ncbi:sce7726 family protein [Staphylococcus aureus]
MDNRNMINRVFSQKILHQIAIKNKSDVVDEAYDFYIQGPKNINVIQKMKSLYNYLKKSYRNEYFYKNTMLNKLLLGRHSVNTTTALSEMPIGKSIADFILLNGKGVVYEIKTELDKDEFLAAPTEIKFLLYFAKMTKKDKNKLYHFLKDANNPPHFI